MSKTRKWPTRALYLVFALALVLGFSVVAVVPAAVQADPGSTAIMLGTNAAGNTVTWDPATVKYGDYSVKLLKDGGGTNGSTYVEFTPDSGITVANFQQAITDATPEWSFWHYLPAATANWVQFELRFEDPNSTGWVEITAVGLQNTLGTAAWLKETLSTTTPAGYGGVGETGTSFFVWGPLQALSGIEAAIDGQAAVTDASDWELSRVRLELWEKLPTRTCYVDDVTIDGTTYEIEPLKFVNASDAEIKTVSSTGSFYLYVENEGWNTSEFIEDTGQVTLKVYDGTGTLMSTNAYTMTESAKNTAHFRTAAISGTALSLKPGYKLEASIGTTSFGTDSTGAVPAGSTPAYAAAKVSFDKTTYSIDEEMTLTVEDDSENTNATTPQTITRGAPAAITKLDINKQGGATVDNLSLVETGIDTGIFQVKVTPRGADTTNIWCGDAMVFAYTNTKTTVGAGTGGADSITKTSYVSATSPSSTAFSPSTIAVTDVSVDVVVIDRDKSADGTITVPEHVYNAVVVKSLAADDSVIDSLTVPDLTEDTAAGQFKATVTFGTAATQLDKTGAAKLQATYTDPNDSSDVSTATATIGYTVELYNASDVLVNSYTTIETAVAASAGNNDYTVVVKSGYASSDEAWPITINNGDTGLTIKAEEGATVILNPAGATDAIDVDDDSVTIEGLTFKNSHTGVSTDNLIDIAPTDTADSLTVKDCTFDLTAGYADDHGINSANAATDSVTITGCSFNVGSRAYGVVSNQAEMKFTVKNSTFTGTDCTLAASGWGIQIAGVPPAVNDFLVQSCTFDSLAEAIDINSNAGYITIRWNTIQNSTVATKGAIDIHTATPNLVLIYGNSIEDNTGYSIFSEGAAAAFDNDINVVFNTITGNTKTLRNNAGVGAPKLNAKHNWWGTTAGPATTDTTGEVTTTYYLTAPVKLTAGYEEFAVPGAVNALDAHLTAGVKVAEGIAGNVNYAGVAEYTESPKAALADASFYDAFIDTTNAGGAADTVTVSFYTEGLTADSVAYFWNDLSGTWDVCSNQGFNSYEGYIWVLAKDQAATVPTSPTIQELTGSMFAISGAEAEEPTPADYDTDGSGAIEINELLVAINDYITGEPGVDISLLLEVINAYITGSL